MSLVELWISNDSSGKTMESSNTVFDQSTLLYHLARRTRPDCSICAAGAILATTAGSVIRRRRFLGFPRRWRINMELAGSRSAAGAILVCSTDCTNEVLAAREL